MGLFAVGAFFWACVFGWTGRYVAIQRGRAPVMGFLLGAVFGPLGPIYVGMLPVIAKQDGATVEGRAWYDQQGRDADRAAAQAVSPPTH